MYKSGYVPIIGKPNVGKSTILNGLLKEKIAIVSKKPETTRVDISGILSGNNFQIVFVDTPGIHKPKNLLGKTMVRKATATLIDTDLILMIIEASSGLKGDDLRIIDLLPSQNSKLPVFLIINKVDLVKKETLLPLIDECSKLYPFVEIIPISAIKEKDLALILNKIVEYLPEGEQFFPEEQLTDKNERFLAGEIIREKILELTYQEVPHSVAALVEEMETKPSKDKKELIYIKATIFIEKSSQKGIIIGRNGELLKKIGQYARIDIENLLGKKVYLDLWVKVYKNWRKDPQAMKMLGYL